MEINLPQDTVSVKNLKASGLGTDVAGTILLGNVGTAMPRVDMDLDVAGKDLALLFKVIEGGALSSQLANLSDRSFDLTAKCWQIWPGNSGHSRCPDEPAGGFHQGRCPG